MPITYLGYVPTRLRAYLTGVGKDEETCLNWNQETETVWKGTIRKADIFELNFTLVATLKGFELRTEDISGTVIRKAVQTEKVPFKVSFENILPPQTQRIIGEAGLTIRNVPGALKKELAAIAKKPNKGSRLPGPGSKSKARKLKDL